VAPATRLVQRRVSAKILARRKQRLGDARGKLNARHTIVVGAAAKAEVCVIVDDGVARGRRPKRLDAVEAVGAGIAQAVGAGIARHHCTTTSSSFGFF